LKYIRLARRLIRCAAGRDLFVRPNHVCTRLRLGSDYGGWEFCPDNISAESIVYSFGVGEDISFDQAMIETFGVTVHAFDPTPRSIAWVRSQNTHSKFLLHEYGLSDSDCVAEFHPPSNPRHVSHSILSHSPSAKASISVSLRRLPTIMTELKHDRIDLLKMDIEGAEYGVIDDLVKSGIRPQQILIEFHHRFKGVGSGKTRAAIRALERAGYSLFSVSASGEEYSFILTKSGADSR